MERHAPHRPGMVFVGLLVLVATSSCDKSNTGVSGGSFAGATAAGAAGADGGAVGGNQNGGGTTGAAGGNATGTGGNASGGGAIVMGGSASGGAADGGSVTQGGTSASNVGGTAPTGGSGTSGGGAACVANSGNYCACMPKFVGVQVVDGAGDEFSALAPMTFALNAAPYINPSRAGSLPEKVTLRAGWSDVALHVHVHVDDPSINPDSSSTLWNGDNVQLFVAPTDNLTGTYTGTEDGGAIHVLISAPSAADLSHAIVIYQNGVSTTTPFVTGLFPGHRVTGGYEIEAQLQWLLVANPRYSGARIGFDLVVGAASDPTQGLALEGGLASFPVSAASPACELGGRIQPGCDDRTWCTPVLE